jgi:hypothetical protein
MSALMFKKLCWISGPRGGAAIVIAPCLVNRSTSPYLADSAAYGISEWTVVFAGTLVDAIREAKNHNRDEDRWRERVLVSLTASEATKAAAFRLRATAGFEGIQYYALDDYQEVVEYEFC